MKWRKALKRSCRERLAWWVEAECWAGCAGARLLGAVVEYMEQQPVVFVRMGWSWPEALEMARSRAVRSWVDNDPLKRPSRSDLVVKALAAEIRDETVRLHKFGEEGEG